MKLKTLLALLLLMMLGQAHAYKLQTVEITVNGTKRNMLCYTPNTMQANMPLWIVTHGMNQDPEYQRDGDHLYELIDAEKFIVCYLRSNGSTWDIGGQGDLNFVRQTITEMNKKFNINKNRVYWSGFSMGSMLIYHGIENGMSDVIAAFAPCSGVKHGSPWVNVKNPINLIHCHGTGDEVFPVDEYKPRDYAYHFVEIDKCKTYKKYENYKPQGAYDAGTKEVWTDGINGTSVEIFMANNHGHWPSVNYTRETWNFCKQFSLATPLEEYENAYKKAITLLEQWQGDVEIFTALSSNYNKLKTAVETYGKDKVDSSDEAALKTATSKLSTAINNFTTTANDNATSKSSAAIKKETFDPNFHIYLCIGGSNMAGTATPELQDYAGSSYRFLAMAPVTMSTYRRSKPNWYVARPPLCRNTTGLSVADYFGKTMVQNTPDSITIGIVNISLEDCGIDIFNEEGIADYLKQQPSALQTIAKSYGSNPFRYLIDMAKKAQEAGVIKGVLLHQGCANSGQQDWAGKVNQVYTKLLQELELNSEEVPLLVGELLQQNQGGTNAAHNEVIAKVPYIINNAYVVSSTGCAGADGISFSNEGYRKMGANYANLMLSLEERYSKRNAYSIKELKAKDTQFTMTASSLHPLYITLTDEDGEKHDVTSACTFTCSEPDVLSFSSVSAISGNHEGDVTVTATFTNDKGEKASVTFDVSVRLFPLTEGSFNPSIIKTGTYKYYSTSKSGRLNSVKGGMGGWTFPLSIDLSDYQYLIIDMSKSAAKPTLRIYDTNNLESTSYYSLSLVNLTQAVVNLKEMTDEEGKAIDPSHIYIIGFTVENTNAVTLKDVRVSNDEPTALDVIHDDVQTSTWYDMTGRKVSQPQRGIYVRDGKKVLK